MRFATYTAAGKTCYGAITDAGAVALSPEYPQWPTLYDVIAAGALDQLTAAARGRAVTHTDLVYEMVMPNAPRILCVGVNFPDRNAEYRDGTLSRMMFPIRREIEYISTFMTLHLGDIIVTGTPAGAGARLDPPKYLRPGDAICAEHRHSRQWHPVR